MMRLRNASALRSAGAVDPADAAQASGIGARKWRPAWEAAPAAAALAASAGTALFGAVGWMPIDAALACGGALALLAGWRTAGALSVWRRRAPLSGFAPLFMTMEDLAARMRAMGDGRLPQAARTGAGIAAGDGDFFSTGGSAGAFILSSPVRAARAAWYTTSNTRLS